MEKRLLCALPRLFALAVVCCAVASVCPDCACVGVAIAFSTEQQLGGAFGTRESISNKRNWPASAARGPVSPRSSSRAGRKVVAFTKGDEGSGSQGSDQGSSDKEHGNPRNKRRKKRRPPHRSSGRSNSTVVENNAELIRRVTQLERLVGKQAVEIQRLKEECRDLSEAAATFAELAELLRQAGLTMEGGGEPSVHQKQPPQKPYPSDEVSGEERNSPGDVRGSGGSDDDVGKSVGMEYFDDTEIFGSAPSSVDDAADAAGAAILAAMLGGKQRILVDVRDAELSRDPDVLVQFIELAILPVAAGLEGLRSTRNRVKVVFPTVSQLLQYRRTMALAAPEVVSLSTLGFDPVEKQDNLVVIIAPAPDDEEGLMQMNELLNPKSSDTRPIKQPVVVLNHHMVPVSGTPANFTVAYHLRLLSVTYMAGDMSPEYVEEVMAKERERKRRQKDTSTGKGKDISSTEDDGDPHRDEEPQVDGEEDAALEAAMEHAHELGVHQGTTRAMVIRAYPRPWHVFVDTSPDADADFEVAATFDEEPSQDDVNYAIVECLEGSEREDELVAQQMQAALEAGQLNTVSEMLGIPPGLTEEDDEESEDDDEMGDFDSYNEDSC